MTRVQAIEAEFLEFAAEGISVDPQQTSGTRPVAPGAVHCHLDESLFKLFDGFLEQNAAINHLRRQGLDLILQSRFLPVNPLRIARGQFSSLPVNRR